MSESRMMFGFHAILSRLRQHPESVQQVLYDKTRGDARMQELLKVVEQKNVRAMQMDKERLDGLAHQGRRSEEHTSELQSLLRISYAVFCLKKKTKKNINK